MSNRILIGSQAVRKWLQLKVPQAEIVESYAPRTDLQNLEAGKLTIFVTPEDVVSIDKNQSKTKFYDEITFTLAILQKVSYTDFTEEVGSLLGIVQAIRDDLRFRRLEFLETHEMPIEIHGVENTGSRPLYDREKLESENLFVSYFLAEVHVHGTREK